MKSVREVALTAIIAMDAGNIHAQAALANTGLSGQDRQLCSDYVYGYMRTRLRLQQLLYQTLFKPQKLPPKMLIALELAVYTLFFQDHVAEYAAVNETVKYIKKHFGQKLANVANGALRNLQKTQFTQPAADASLQEWANFYSMPKAICELWHKAYGRKATIMLMQRAFQRPYTCLRVNSARGGSQELLTALRQLEDAIAVGKTGVAYPPGKIPKLVLGKSIHTLESEGCLSFQAAASQLILTNLQLYEAWQGDIPVWDACAGFGGKTLALLECGLPVSLATDISSQRLRHLAPQVARLGLAQPAIMLASAVNVPLAGWSGHIFVDAPCSGLGVLARRPDIKARFTLANVSELIVTQYKLLLSLVDILMPGRELAYITCTLNPAENEAQINRLLQTRPNLEICAVWQTPHDHPWLEGMYGCRIRKNFCHEHLFQARA